MSTLRPELKRGSPNDFTLDGATAYLTILKAVEQHPEGLIHGKLHGYGAHCAIGCYFDINHAALYETMIDEVATVNDSVPTYSRKRRRQHVIQWLRWKLRQVSMPLVGRPSRNPLEKKAC